LSSPDRQLALALGAFRNRGLFSDHFLAERLVEWPEFAGADVRPLYEELQALWVAEHDALPSANEAQTEQRFVQPVLTALGFSYIVQGGLAVAGGRRQPDYALFVSDQGRRSAERLEGAARYGGAVCVADAKRFGRPLDGRGTGLSGDPVAQIVHYVAITRRPWGLLTNGRLWRLYSSRRNLLEGAYYEIDLVALLEADDPGAFRWFGVLLAASAFAAGDDGSSLLDRILAESQTGAVQVGAALERQVFEAVPGIAAGLLGEEERSETTTAAAYDHALVLLYRLLFCLHAEARGLLPVENPHYLEYSLRKQKEELAADRDGGRRFSRHSDDLYNDLRALFRIVDRGDSDIGVSEYNGGLFSSTGYPYFEGRSVPDDLLAPALDALYRVEGGFVDYRDLSARHLGTIYERLLDYQLEDAGGSLSLRPASGRRDSGSYYTPEQVVDRIVERTLDPLLSRRSANVAALGLTSDEALDHFLNLRVLDPAMGSGHFLVAAAGWIATHIATDPSYGGDLSIDELRRRVAERCLYGLDLNPMAVELAQLSLWLATARRNEPLTFLVNLRVGNALVGADLERLLAGGPTIFADRLARDAQTMLEQMEAIAQRTSETGSDVHEKERLLEAAASLRRPLEEHADESLREAFRDGDPQPFHWALEYPEVFLSLDGRPRDDGGFDAVLGNPPYVRIQAMGRDLAEWCRRHYETASGSFDTYVPFIERSVRLLAPGGRLGFIVPNKLTKLDYARSLRELLAGEQLVEEMIDFGDAQVFGGATNYTCVLVLDRRGGEEMCYRTVPPGPAGLRAVLDDFGSAPGARFSLTRLGGDPWVLATGEQAQVLKTLAQGSERLGDVAQQIFQGLITSADPIYLLEDRGPRGSLRAVYSRASGAELELEPALLHPLASGPDVDRYAFRRLRTLLLFPYREDGGRMRLLSEEELSGVPRTHAYLRSHETTLRGRERGKMDHERWFGYVYPKSLSAHVRPKLGFAATVQHLEVAADLEGAVYFHNVRVNGLLPRSSGPSLPTLLAFAQQPACRLGLPPRIRASRQRLLSGQQAVHRTPPDPSPYRSRR
jgi:hypothetical protein